MMLFLVVLLFDQETVALSVSIKKWEHRSIEEPSTEPVVRGPREGFNENIRSSTALLHRKIRTPNLKMKSFTIGADCIKFLYAASTLRPSIIKITILILKQKASDINRASKSVPPVLVLYRSIIPTPKPMKVSPTWANSF